MMTRVTLVPSAKNAKIAQSELNPDGSLVKPAEYSGMMFEAQAEKSEADQKVKDAKEERDEASTTNQDLEDWIKILKKRFTTDDDDQSDSPGQSAKKAKIEQYEFNGDGSLVKPAEYSGMNFEGMTYHVLKDEVVYISVFTVY